MTDPLERIWDACWVAVRMGLRITSTFTGPPVFQEGRYQPPPDEPVHPLEVLLWTVEGCSGNFTQDVAKTLGVDVAWVQGFIEGLAQAGENSASPDYVQGYLVAECLRTQRFPRIGDRLQRTEP